MEAILRLFTSHRGPTVCLGPVRDRLKTGWGGHLLIASLGVSGHSLGHGHRGWDRGYRPSITVLAAASFLSP